MFLTHPLLQSITSIDFDGVMLTYSQQRSYFPIMKLQLFWPSNRILPLLQWYGNKCFYCLLRFISHSLYKQANVKMLHHITSVNNRSHMHFYWSLHSLDRLHVCFIPFLKCNLQLRLLMVAHPWMNIILTKCSMSSQTNEDWFPTDVCPVTLNVLAVTMPFSHMV